MIRYAIISDIHGNLEALKAVLSDIKTQQIDRVVCLGDIISKGTHGHECLQLIKENADAVVRGNNDIYYTKTLDEIANNPNFDYDYFYWIQKQLSGDDINFLRNLPMCCEFKLSGRLVRCFHASSEDTETSVFNFSDYDEKLALFNPSKYSTKEVADVVVYGHIHHPSYEKLFGYTLINAGSVGNALNCLSDKSVNNVKMSEFTMAEYVILTGSDGKEVEDIAVEFRNVKYNKSKELEDYGYSPHKAIYENEIYNGEYRYPERIRKRLTKNLKHDW